MNNDMVSPINNVFSTPELLAIILGYYYDGYLFHRTCNCDHHISESLRHTREKLDLRLVNTLWLQEVSKIAFRSCNIETLLYLKKLRNLCSRDYGPLVKNAKLDVTYEQQFCEPMSKGKDLNLENLTTLTLYCFGRHDDSIGKIFRTCTRLERIELSQFKAGDATGWVLPLLEIAPHATYYIEALLPFEHDKIFQIVSENKTVKFLLTCDFDSIEIEDPGEALEEVCESLEKYPEAGQCIKKLYFEMTADEFVIFREEVSWLFGLVSSKLESVALIITDIECGGTSFFEDNVIPALRLCTSIRKMNILLKNDYPDELHEPRVREVGAKWRTQVAQCLAGLESLGFTIEFKNGSDEYVTVSFE